jgi:molybdenum cofactor cytidylyltransferase
MRIGVIVLAAGASSRMGSPKQLLRYGGQTLIRRAAEAAIASSCNRVAVVIGSNASQMRRELKDLPVSVVENQNWQTGMSSSIRAGLDELRPHDLDGVVIMLCDQPFVTAGILNDLIATHRQTGKPIVASCYETTKGVPAFFSRDLFTDLTSLSADEGARRLIVKHPELVATINFPEGAIDIDTPHDTKKLSHKKAQKAQK